MGEQNARAFGTTRSYWLQRRKALSAQFDRLMIGTGDAEVLAAMNEATRLLEQIDLEAVREDPLTLQFLLERYRVPCARLAQAAMEDVPGGKDLLKDMSECEKVLKIPDTSIIVVEDPYLRPDHDVDLSVLAPFFNQGLGIKHVASAGTTASAAEAGEGHSAPASSVSAADRHARKRGHASIAGDGYQSAERKETTAASKPCRSSRGQDEHQVAQTKVPKKRRWLPWFAS